MIPAAMIGIGLSISLPRILRPDPMTAFEWVVPGIGLALAVVVTVFLLLELRR